MATTMSIKAAVDWNFSLARWNTLRAISFVGELAVEASGGWLPPRVPPGGAPRGEKIRVDMDMEIDPPEMLSCWNLEHTDSV